MTGMWRRISTGPAWRWPRTTLWGPMRWTLSKTTAPRCSPPMRPPLPFPTAAPGSRYAAWSTSPAPAPSGMRCAPPWLIFRARWPCGWATSLRAPTPLPPWCGRPTTTSPPAPWACRSLPSPSTPPPAGSSALWRSCSPIPRTPRRCVKRAMTSRARQMPWCSLSGPISSPPPPGRPSSFPWFGSTSAPGRRAVPPPGTPCWATGRTARGWRWPFSSSAGRWRLAPFWWRVL